MLDAIEAAQKRAPRREPFNLRGAAYRIRTYDALIRSQVLYPAEVTPRARTYIASHAPIRQARIGKNFAGSKIIILHPVLPAVFRQAYVGFDFARLG